MTPGPRWMGGWSPVRRWVPIRRWVTLRTCVIVLMLGTITACGTQDATEPVIEGDGPTPPDFNPGHPPPAPRSNFPLLSARPEREPASDAPDEPDEPAPRQDPSRPPAHTLADVSPLLAWSAH